MPNGDWMVVGRIAGVFGIGGEVKVEPYTDNPGRFSSLTDVYLGPVQRRVGVERSRPHKNLVLLKLAGIDSPEAARALGSVDVSVPRADALPLPEGHFYLEDMIGVAVRDAAGKQIGAVTDVLRTGSNDVFVVGQGASAVLVPAIHDAILDLDVPNRLLVVAEWILEPYL